MDTSIGEYQITPQIVESIAPDLVKGKKPQIIDKSLDAQEANRDLKIILLKMAVKIGAKAESRIKDVNVMLQKIVAKRLEGRNYNEDDLNDIWGGRIIIKNVRDEKRAIQMIHQAEKDGKFKIIKEQPIDKDTYHAYHFDIEYKLPNGHIVSGELQIHTPQTAAQSAVTHDLHYRFGNNPPVELKKPIDHLAAKVQKLSNNKAMQVAHALVAKRKSNDDLPLPHIVTKRIVDNISK